MFQNRPPPKKKYQLVTVITSVGRSQNEWYNQPACILKFGKNRPVAYANFRRIVPKVTISSVVISCYWTEIQYIDRTTILLKIGEGQSGRFCIESSSISFIVIKLK